MGQMCQIFVSSIKWKEISHSAGCDVGWLSPFTHRALFSMLCKKSLAVEIGKINTNLSKICGHLHKILPCSIMTEKMSSVMSMLENKEKCIPKNTVSHIVIRAVLYNIHILSNEAQLSILSLLTCLFVAGIKYHVSYYHLSRHLVDCQLTVQLSGP